MFNRDVAVKVVVPHQEVVSLEGAVMSIRWKPTAKGAMTIASLAVATGDTYDCIWWNRIELPSGGARIAVRGTGTKNGDVSVSTWTVFDHDRKAPEHRLLDYYKSCLDAENHQEGPVSVNSRSLLPLRLAGSPFELPSMDLPIDTVATRWKVARQVSGRSEIVSLCWPIEAISADGGTAVVPVLSAEAELVDGRLVPRRGTLQIDEDFLRHRGLDSERAEALLGEAATLPASPETFLNLLRRHELLDIGEPPETAERVHSTTGTRFHAVAIARTTTQSAIVRRLIGELDELKVRPLGDLRAGPLGALLNGATGSRDRILRPMPSVVRTNLDQERVVQASRTEVLTVVTGPPGTGKSQAITNAVAAAVVAGEKVLVASKNNHAIDVVADRIRSIDPAVHVVRVGKRDLLGPAATALGSWLTAPARPVDPVTAQENWVRACADLEARYRPLAERIDLARRIESEEREAERLRATLRDGIVPLSADAEVDLLVVATDRARREHALLDRRPSRWFWAKRSAAKARRSFEDRLAADVHLAAGSASTLESMVAQGRTAEVIAILERLLDLRRAETSASDIRLQLSLLPDEATIDDDISSSGPDRYHAATKLVATKMEQRRTQPASLAAATGYQVQLQSAVAPQAATSAVYAARGAAAGALDALPIWAVTSLAVGSVLPLQRELFDLVIIDEASQSDIASALPLLFRARRALIIGDPNQLTHITSIGPPRDEALASFHGVEEDLHATFGYRSRSLYHAAAAATASPPVLLRRHYRSHPVIAGFASATFYGGALRVHTDLDRLLPGPPLRWIDVPGVATPGPHGQSMCNRREAEHVLLVLADLVQELDGTNRSIGVVSPFRAQVDLLIELLAAKMPQIAGSITIDTAHGFQGDERDVIVYSPVISEDVPARSLTFAADRNLVNVALTRARSRLVVVGDLAACENSGTVLAALAAFWSALS